MAKYKQWVNIGGSRGSREKHDGCGCPSSPIRHIYLIYKYTFLWYVQIHRSAVPTPAYGTKFDQYIYLHKTGTGILTCPC